MSVEQNILAVEIPWPVSESGMELKESEISIVKLLEHTVNDLRDKLKGQPALEQSNHELELKVQGIPSLVKEHVEKALSGRINAGKELETLKGEHEELKGIKEALLDQIVSLQRDVLGQKKATSAVSQQLDIAKLENETLSAVNRSQAEEIEQHHNFQSQNERLIKENEMMRKDRNDALAAANLAQDELDNLKTKFASQERLLNENGKELRQAKAQVKGIPKLIENKVATALADHKPVDTFELDEANKAKDTLTEQLQKSKSKNISLNETVGQLRQQLVESEQNLTLHTELVVNQSEIIESMEIGMLNADQNYKHVMHHLDELQGFCSIITNENHGLRNDNLYLDQIRELHNMRQVWASDCLEWQAFFVARSGMLNIDSDKGAPEPDERFGIVFLLNTQNGCGHTCYLDSEGVPVFPISAHKDHLLPKPLRESFVAGVKALPIKAMEAAVKMSTERARKLVHYADLLDINWNTTISHVEVAKRLNDYVSEKELVTRFEAIERAKLLAPRSASLIERINKRFGSEYSLRNGAGKINPNKPKRNSNRKKKRK